MKCRNCRILVICEIWHAVRGGEGVSHRLSKILLAASGRLYRVEGPLHGDKHKKADQAVVEKIETLLVKDCVYFVEKEGEG